MLARTGLPFRSLLRHIRRRVRFPVTSVNANANFHVWGCSFGHGNACKCVQYMFEGQGHSRNNMVVEKLMTTGYCTAFSLCRRQMCLMDIFKRREKQLLQTAADSVCISLFWVGHI